MLVTKAIIPAAGLGTRFLPATKAVPKEMIPLLDKPSIQYVVEEGIKSGVKNFILVTGKNKGAIVDHFSMDSDFLARLETKNKAELLGNLSKIPSIAHFMSIRQDEPLGLGHAIWTARHAIGKEYVSIMLPDDIFIGPDPGLSQLIKIAAQEKCSVVAVQEVPKNQVSRYGVIDVKKQFSPNLFQVRDLVEKPSPEDAPSCLAIVGRYVLSPNIFEALESTSVGAIGEVQLTDGIQKLIFSGEKVFAYKVKGERYDVGTPLGLLKASVRLALQNQKYSSAMLDFLSELDREMIVLQGKAAKQRFSSSL
ncbi:UTP--glucose-1-phosphate uridylyltransferase GalU [Candidatus Dependentiae bacterium]|nr:UTP--glucose-1-phosphate uridylyltransferase GalU [Candidatus Dependentiae bacterium]